MEPEEPAVHAIVYFYSSITLAVVCNQGKIIKIFIMLKKIRSYFGKNDITTVNEAIIVNLYDL